MSTTKSRLVRSVLLSGLTAAVLFTAACGAPESTSATGAAAGATTSGDANDASSQQLKVSPVPSGQATSAAVSRSGDGGRTTKKSTLKVASYNATSGRAVIKTATRQQQTSSPSATSSTSASASASASTSTSPSASASASVSDSASASADTAVAVGDVIASAPASGAPDGVLAKVTEVVGQTTAGTEVDTEPATLSDLLQDDSADGTVAVDPSSIGVDTLVPGVKISWAKTGDLTFGPEGAKLPLGNLRLDVSAAVATATGAPASAAASVKGFVQLAPQVEFSYNGSGTADTPSGAFIGLSGDWASQWELKGQAAAATDDKPLRIAFAKLHADPVLQVGPVPVVVNLDLTCYFEVNGDGKISVDVKQDLTGDFRVGGSFSLAKGWTPVSTSQMKGTPLSASVEAAGKVKASLGAEASVGLYGTVGVIADFAPYLRGEASGTATGSTTGSASGSAVGAWSLFGGLDLTGALQLKLTIFGTPIFEQRIPLGELHREWLLTQGTGATT